MARIFVDGEVILKISYNEEGIDIGSLPEDFSKKHYRFDGKKLVNLYDLDEFYVDKNTKELFIKPKSNTILLKMNFSDRNRLIFDSGTVRLQTYDEINQEEQDEYKRRRASEYDSIGDQLDAILRYLDPKNDLSDELRSIITKWKNTKEKWPKS